jgi:hypothetical protein
LEAKGRNMDRRLGLLAARTCLATVCAVALPAAAATPSERADAEGLAAAAAVLVENGDFVHACAKYEASARLDPQARRYMKLADCFERAGMTSRAWMAFGDAREMADLRGDKVTAQSARDNAKRIGAKLAYIAVDVPRPSEVEGLQIRRDGALVSDAVRGVGVPVDAGNHVISASAPGRRPWSTTIGLAPGTTTVTVVIPFLDEEPEASSLEGRGQTLSDDLLADRGPRAAIAPPPALVHDSASLTPIESDPGKSQRTMAYVVGGAGLASLAGSLYFGLAAASNRASLAERCSGTICTADARDTVDTARSQAMASSVLFFTGVVSLGGAAIVYFTAPSAPKPERSTATLQIAPSVAPGGAGLFASGRF